LFTTATGLYKDFVVRHGKRRAQHLLFSSCVLSPRFRYSPMTFQAEFDPNAIEHLRITMEMGIYRLLARATKGNGIREGKTIQGTQKLQLHHPRCGERQAISVSA
jgi:hypothetical protein